MFLEPRFLPPGYYGVCSSGSITFQSGIVTFRKEPFLVSLRSLVLFFPTTLISDSISKVSDALINARHLTLSAQCSKTQDPESLQHETNKHVPQMLLPQINREPNLAPKAQLFETRPAKSPRSGLPSDTLS